MSLSGLSSRLSIQGGAIEDNWHIAAIAHAFERVWMGKTKRLIVTLPPRSLKSMIASVAFPAFLLGHDPTRRIICASYAQDLATKFHDEFRRVIESDWFHALFPEAALAPLKDTGQELILPKNGSRFATSVGGTLTGRGADILIIDDPLKAQDAYSEVRREGVNDWLRATAMSRLDDKRNGAVIIIMQRLHVDDPVGHLLERSPDDWDVLDLPAIAPADIEIATGWKTQLSICRRCLASPRARTGRSAGPASPGSRLGSLRGAISPTACAARRQPDQARMAAVLRFRTDTDAGLNRYHPELGYRIEDGARK